MHSRDDRLRVGHTSDLVCCMGCVVWQFEANTITTSCNIVDLTAGGNRMHCENELSLKFSI